MPIDARLLEILVCPACRGEVKPVESDSGLECQACGRVFEKIQRFKHPSRKTLLKLSLWPFCQGLPGSMYRVSMPRSESQSWTL